MAETPIVVLPHPDLSIFHLIHELHQVVTKSIDSALTWDQLNSPPIQYTLVRPFVTTYAEHIKSESKKERGTQRSRTKDGLLKPQGARADDGEARNGSWPLGAVLYALMANRVQFINLAGADLSYAAMQNARASFCELLAMKIIRASPHANDEAELVDALVHGWCAFEGAAEDIWASFGDEKQEVLETTGSALELAIVSRSKRFLSLPLIQHLISQIYSGHLIYLPVSNRSLISDSYISERTKKRRQASHSNTSRPASPSRGGVTNGEVFTYNPYEAGWLDHQRLRVPKWRNALEFLNFGVLLGLFVATLAFRDINLMTIVEIVSIVFTFGFILDEFAASQEHGWTADEPSTLQTPGMLLIWHIMYLVLRVFALLSHSPATSDLAFDILACGACVLFPRLVFFLIKDHVIIIALKAMVSRFLGFMGLTSICFCLWTLGRATWTVKQIIWLMLQIWFGSSYLGFSASESFHPIFGPIILISYAALCNVLLITCLIAILSNKFAEINGNAQEEHMFQRVVKTVEGVKSDPIFSYMPPVNLVAFVLLSPMSWVCEARTLHRINVFCVRLANFPILFLISAYERWAFRTKATLHLREDSDLSAESAQRPRMFDSWLGGGSEVLISSVFDFAPPPSVLRAGVSHAAAFTSSLPSEISDSDTSPFSSSARQAHAKEVRPTRARAGGFESPLARIFGGGTGSRRKRSSKGGKGELHVVSDKNHGRSVQTLSNGEATDDTSVKEDEKRKKKGLKSDTDEVDRLKRELSEVRESQLRMEEMLNKLLNPAAGE